MALAVRALASATATSNGATSISVSPTGMQDGDWLIFFLVTSGGANTHSNTAGSLTRVHDDLNNGNVIVTSTWKKKSGAGEAGPYSFSVGGVTRRIAVAVRCFSGGDATDIIDAAPAFTAYTAGTASGDATGATPTVAGGLHLVFCGARTGGGVAQTFTWTAGYTEIYEFGSTHASSSNANIGWAEKSLPTTDPTGDVTVTVGTAERFSAGTMILKPAENGAQTVNPTGVASAATVGSPAFAAVIASAGVASSAAVGAPTVSPGPVEVAPSGVASAAAAGVPAVSSYVDVTPVGVASTSAVGAPTVSGDASTIAATGVPSTSAAGAPTVTPGAVTIQPGGAPTTSAVGAPTLLTTVTVAPAGVGSASAAGQPVVTALVTVAATGVPSGAAVGAPTLVAVVAALGVSSASAVGAPAVQPGPVTVALASVGSSAAVGLPTVLAFVAVTAGALTVTGDQLGHQVSGDAAAATATGDRLTLGVI